MLTECGSLYECEQVLQHHLRHNDVRWFQQIPISREDIDRLNRFFDEESTSGWEAFPVALSVLLVWAGIDKYAGGEYWSDVHELMGSNDTNQQSRWGQTFLSTIEKWKLGTTKQYRRRFVDQILLHGGIPTSNLHTFFNILWRLYRERGTVDRGAFVRTVTEWQDKAREASALDSETPILQQQIGELSSLIKKAEQYCNISVNFTAKADKHRILYRLASMSNRYQDHLFHLRSLHGDIARVKERQKGIAEARADIADEYAEVQIQLEALRSMAHRIQDEYKNVQTTLIYLSSAKRTSTGEDQATSAGDQPAVLDKQTVLRAKNLLKRLHRVQQEFHQACSQLAAATSVTLTDGYEPEFVSQLEREIYSIREHRLAELDASAEQARLELARLRSSEQSVQGAMKDITTEWRRRLDTADEAIRELGLPAYLGDIEHHARLLDHTRKIERGIDRLRRGLTHLAEKLKAQFPHAPSINKNTAAQMAEKWRSERTSLERRLENLGDPPSLPLSDADRPVQLFLLYGGEEALRFIFHTSSLLAETLREGNPQIPDGWPGGFRYELVAEEFLSWWHSESKGRMMDANDRRLTFRLVAWQDGGQWFLGVQLPEFLANNPSVSVSQNGYPLDSCWRFPRCWALGTAEEPVTITWNDAWADAETPSYTTAVFDPTKWRQADMNVTFFRGWHGGEQPLTAVHRSSGAKRLIFVSPREDAPILTGLEVDPTPYQLFQPRGLYFFYAERSDAELTFYLDGEKKALDADSDLGPIFTGEDITLRCGNIDDIDGPATIGSVHLEPSGNVDLHPSIDEVLEGITIPLRSLASGCYEVVIKDDNHGEVYRLPFRLLRDAAELAVLPMPTLFPEEEDTPERPSTFILSLPPESLVRGGKIGQAPSFRKITLRGERVQYELPADPSWDTTQWTIRMPGAEEVPLAIRLPRLWWTLEGTGNQGWLRTPLVIQRKWFAPTSDKLIRIKVPTEAVGRRARVKVGGHEPRTYWVKQGEIRIYLRDFYDLIRSHPEEDLIFTLHLAKGGDFEAAGQFAIAEAAYRNCDLCSSLGEGVKRAPYQDRNCFTCTFAKRFPGGQQCVKNKWGPLGDGRFWQWATSVCDEWDGEYPGQPFTAREAGGRALVGRRLRFITSVPGVPVLSGSAGKVVSYGDQRVLTRWETDTAKDNDRSAMTELWMCKYHLEKYTKRITLNVHPGR